MRIAILHSGDLESVSMGGVDRYVKSIIEFMPNVEITVFGTGKYGEIQLGKKYKRNYHGKDFEFIPITDDKRRPLSVFYMLKEILYVKELGKYDCIYAQRTEYSIPFAFSKNKNKLIQLIHGSSKYSEIGFGHKMAKIHLLLEKLAIGIAKNTYIILNRDEFGAPYYKGKYPKYANRIRYQRNPINPDNFLPTDKCKAREKLGFPSNNKIIVFTGRVVHNPKRVLLFPEICKGLISKGYKYTFVVVGDGSDSRELQNRVRESNIENQFVFPGYIEDTNVIAQYYNASDIAINISMFEGTCTSNLEALATGTPLISTDVGDIKEVLDGIHNGIIVNNYDDESKIVQDVVSSIIYMTENEIKMDNSFMKYAGTEVAEELRKNICELGK